MNNSKKVKMASHNWRFNFVELAGSVGASGVTHYAPRSPRRRQ